MASNISNYASMIDTVYPVTGQDNDTQGFRDNFIAIKNALGSVGDAITVIQDYQDARLGKYPLYGLSEPATSVGAEGDAKGTVFATTTSMFICFGDYVNTTTDIWCRINGVSSHWPQVPPPA
jgi:hypothetical protein